MNGSMIGGNETFYLAAASKQHVLADKEDERSLSDSARSLGVSRERLRQLNVRALATLRRELGDALEGGAS
jgi:DNA-directed RNA polymerase sigma subunit (sigma70/sigma32)